MSQDVVQTILNGLMMFYYSIMSKGDQVGKMRKVHGILILTPFELMYVLYFNYQRIYFLTLAF